MRRCFWLLMVLACVSCSSSGPSPAAAPSSSVSTVKLHQGLGVIVAITDDRASAKIKHGPIPSLQMPAMTMPWKMESAKVLEGIKTGDEVNFVVTETADGEYYVSKVTLSR